MNAIHPPPIPAKSKREDELVQQLSAVLAQTPTRTRDATRDRKTADDVWNDWDPSDNDKELFGTPSSHAPPNHAWIDAGIDPDDTAPNMPAQESDNNLDADNSVDAHTDVHTINVAKTSRRARFRHGAQQVGSWLITLAVTGFITACVWIMLLGLPKEFDPRPWLSFAPNTNSVIASPATTRDVPGE